MCMHALKQHVKTLHSNLYNSLPFTLFTVATGFYLAVHPQDYGKIAEVGRYEQECFETRKDALCC